MITPNMEALSLVELQYIAKKQGINGSDWMKREDLIEALEEIFEDDTTLPNDESSNFTPSNQRRFLNSLVEHKNKKLTDLPGVVTLPDCYSQTSIHLLLVDPYWAYAYWDVCPTEFTHFDQLEEEYSLFLRVNMIESHCGAEDGDSYDITIDSTDSSWNVNLPRQGRAYKVALMYGTSNGKEGMLCQSNVVTSPCCRWIDKAEILNRDDKLFTLVFSSITTKGKVVIDCPLVQEIVTAMDTAGRE